MITKCCTLTSFISTVTTAQKMRFLPFLVEGHKPALEETVCCFSCFRFSSGNSTYGEGATYWGNHCVTNSPLCPCGLVTLVNSAKEVNHDQETYKSSSKQVWDWRQENPHCKHPTSSRDFQMLVTRSNTARVSWGRLKSLIKDPDRHCEGNHNKRDER